MSEKCQQATWYVALEMKEPRTLGSEAQCQRRSSLLGQFGKDGLRLERMAAAELRKIKCAVQHASGRSHILAGRTGTI
jgi:hypothetical protein